MKEILLISIGELSNLKISLNAYLTMLMLKNGNIRYKYTDEDLNELVVKGWLQKDKTFTAKLLSYFKSDRLFNIFYNTFPHTVPIDFGGVRPLRATSVDTISAKTTKVKWNRKSKGNIELQNKIIEVLSAEIEWRVENNSLRYMNNIDTWLNKNNYEKYEYLLNIESFSKDMTKDL